MEFQEKTLRIKDITAGARRITAWVGEGTGLAYVRTLDTAGNHLNTYNLTHMSSGYALPYLVRTEAEAQSYLEKVAVIFEDRWNCDLRTVKKRLRYNRTHIMSLIEIAHYDSLDPFIDHFLYAATDTDVCSESQDAADKDPNHAENEKIAQQLLSQHPEATKAVMACVADADGVHNILRTFERAAAVELI